MHARSIDALLFSLILMVTCVARAGELIVQLPQGQTPASGAATDPAIKQDFSGESSERTIRFKDLPAGVPLDVKIATREGPILQGFDASWYADVDPPATPPEPLSEDDVKEITSIVRDIPSFYSRSDLLHLSGSRERAVALVQLVRDVPFHGDAGGEIIWRVEVWYFENQAGGWAKVVQANKILRRERFKSKSDYDHDAGKIRWVAELGGVKVKAGNQPTRVELKAVEEKPPVEKGP